GLNTEELCALVQELGEPAYRGKQLAEGIYMRGVKTFEEMSNLPARLRTKLIKDYKIGRSRTIDIQRSKDGTIKLLLEVIPKTKDQKQKIPSFDKLRMSGETKIPLNLPLRKGEDLIETVGIPYADRFSCCLSTQVGCPVGCVFCATGLGGFTRNLTAGEIVDQVLAVQEAAGDRRVDHVVFMGMGEPLLNYEATLKSMRLLNEELGIAMRHLTVSTVGFLPGIRRLAQEKLQVTLAVSLHSGTDQLRRKLITGMKFSLAEIISSCKEYLRQTGRRVTFEYCLLDGINDGTVEAQALAKLLRGMNCHVNLIPYNPVSGLDFQTRSRQRIKAFREVLEGAGIQVTQRLQRGADIDAACGQLKARKGEVF
ncbi:MAG TPA: 23S rRNA (adenine(2503)-C(2))-methyltransferase RlmN, partial [Dehalococcoidia bacterium]